MAGGVVFIPGVSSLALRDWIERCRAGRWFGRSSGIIRRMQASRSSFGRITWAAALVVVGAGLVAPLAWARQKPLDRVRLMQVAAEAAGRAAWGHWGDQPSKYVSWSNHSNRLIPLYAFGMGIDAVSGTASVYRDADRLEALGATPKS